MITVIMLYWNKIGTTAQLTEGRFMKSDQRQQRQDAEDVFKGGAIILTNGTEVPFTEAMIKQAFSKLLEDCFYPELQKKTHQSS